MGPKQEVLPASEVDWTFGSRTVCRKYWSHLTGIGKNKITAIIQQLKAGHTEPTPVKTHRMPGIHQGDQMRKADMWIHNLYETIAENLSESKGERRRLCRFPRRQFLPSSTKQIWMVMALAALPWCSLNN